MSHHSNVCATTPLQDKKTHRIKFYSLAQTPSLTNLCKFGLFQVMYECFYERKI